MRMSNYSIYPTNLTHLLSRRVRTDFCTISKNYTIREELTLENEQLFYRFEKLTNLPCKFEKLINLPCQFEKLINLLYKFETIFNLPYKFEQPINLPCKFEKLINLP